MNFSQPLNWSICRSFSASFDLHIHSSAFKLLCVQFFSRDPMRFIFVDYFIFLKKYACIVIISSKCFASSLFFNPSFRFFYWPFFIGSFPYLYSALYYFFSPLVRVLILACFLISLLWFSEAHRPLPSQRFHPPSNIKTSNSQNLPTPPNSFTQ